MLANPVRGQIGFVIGGAGYTLSFSVNALVALETELDATAAEIAGRMNGAGMRVGELRTVFRAGLQDHHPDVTEAEAGDIIGQLGIKRAALLIGETFLAAFPAVEEGTAEAGPRPGVGTGRRSTRTGAKSASTPASSGASPRA